MNRRRTIERIPVSLVGAGPGDPELLTLRALKRVQQADVLLYDALIDERILEETRPDCLKIYAGKKCRDGQNPEQRQNEIHRQMAFHFREGRQVVRLKAGDPMIFGRGMEEVRFLESENIPWEVVPGISAGIAASSAFALPLTERNKSRMVLFTSGYTSSGETPGCDPLVSVIKEGGTVVVYMGLSKLRCLLEVMEKAGIGNIPLMIADRVSQEGEQLIAATTDTVLARLESEQVQGPSLVMVGKYLETLEPKELLKSLHQQLPDTSLLI